MSYTNGVNLDAAGNGCPKCKGRPWDHEFDCPEIERLAALGIPGGRRFPGGAFIQLKTWAPDFAHALPLPAGYSWCAECGAAKLPHKHEGEE